LFFFFAFLITAGVFVYVIPHICNTLRNNYATVNWFSKDTLSSLMSQDTKLVLLRNICVLMVPYSFRYSHITYSRMLVAPCLLDRKCEVKNTMTISKVPMKRYKKDHKKIIFSSPFIQSKTAHNCGRCSISMLLCIGWYAPDYNHF
jgi:hypothetical protein